MHNFRKAPRFRSLKLFPLAFISLTILASFTNLPFARAFAPGVEAMTIAGDVAEYLPADIPSSGDRNLDLIILRAGERHGVDPRLLHAVIWQESKYKPRAESHKGAQGLMQLIPATARRFNCQNASNPEENVDAGTRYLRWLLKRFNGDVVLALAGYNAGEGSVDKYDGVPPYNETQNYVRIITARYGKTFHPLLTPEQARVQFNLTPATAMVSE